MSYPVRTQQNFPPCFDVIRDFAQQSTFINVKTSCPDRSPSPRAHIIQPFKCPLSFVSFPDNMSARIAEAAKEEASHVKQVTLDGVQSGAYLYPIKVSVPLGVQSFETDSTTFTHIQI